MFMSKLINFIALVKGQDRYMFFYDDQSQETLLEIFNRYASDRRLSFSSRDAKYLSKKVKERIFRNETNNSDRLEHMFKKYD